MTDFSTFDVADYLENEEVIAEYLTAACEDENSDVFHAALADVAKARGITREGSGQAVHDELKALKAMPLRARGLS